KTNLLEAVLVLARGGSYRAKDAELVRFNKPWARLDAHSQLSGQRTVKLVNDPLPTKTYELGGQAYKRLTITHSLPVVLFEPNHLRLLSGGPEARRDYLDDLLEQTTPGYGTVRRQYKRALAQRNALLKQPGPPSHSSAFPWDVRLSQLAGQIVRARQQLTEEINQELSKLYKKLSKAKTVVTITYASRWPVDSYETQLLKRFETGWHDDRQRGFTSSGPHREDFTMFFDGHPAAQTASRGEVRTAVLALKIIELKIIEAARGTSPLLLLDDVFSELDGRRRHALTDYLAPYQTFITTTDADLVAKNFTQEANIIPLAP
ncbi:DNA replication/repair protein RecF, partial [Candidatus Saccharibacteria bacterium CG_4_10_14_0_2_um_filter_52_9]